ncbi:hypothetical protein DSECCO2_390730 [anaerobic digester metagenome]
MSMLKEIWNEILLVLGLKRAPKREELEQKQDQCSVRDCWGEMAARTREGRQE